MEKHYEFELPYVRTGALEDIISSQIFLTLFINQSCGGELNDAKCKRCSYVL